MDNFIGSKPCDSLNLRLTSKVLLAELCSPETHMLNCQPPVSNNVNNVFSTYSIRPRMGPLHIPLPKTFKAASAEKEAQYLNGTGHFENYFLIPGPILKDLMDLREKAKE